MRTLIIHPEDPSTDFLHPIYEKLPDITVITGGISYMDVRQLIKEHDRVIAMGHGSPYGLFSMGKFPNSGVYIIDGMMSDLLSEKNNNIYVWCHANIYFSRYNLKGFSTSMFISEVSESEYCGVHATQEQVDESNNIFATELGRLLVTSPINEIYDVLKQNYISKSSNNKIAKYNVDGFTFRE